MRREAIRGLRESRIRAGGVVKGGYGKLQPVALDHSWTDRFRPRPDCAGGDCPWPLAQEAAAVIARFLQTEAGRATFGVLFALLVCTPAFIWRGWGAVVMLVAIFAFLGGYAYARWEWRRRGYVPRFDAPLPEDPVNAPSRQRLPK